MIAVITCCGPDRPLRFRKSSLIPLPGCELEGSRKRRWIRRYKTGDTMKMSDLAGPGGLLRGGEMGRERICIVATGGSAWLSCRRQCLELVPLYLVPAPVSVCVYQLNTDKTDLNGEREKLDRVDERGVAVGVLLDSMETSTLLK